MHFKRESKVAPATRNLMCLNALVLVPPAPLSTCHFTCCVPPCDQSTSHSVLHHLGNHVHYVDFPSLRVLHRARVSLLTAHAEFSSEDGSLGTRAAIFHESHSDLISL